MAEHRAFRAACRARGVEDRGEIAGGSRNGLERSGFGVRGLHQGSGARAVERQQDGIICFRDCRQLGLGTGIADDKARFGVADKIGDLGRRIGCVQRQEHRTGTHTGRIERQRLGRFLDLDGDPVSRHHARRHQRIGDLSRPGKEIRIGHDPAVRQMQEGTRIVGLGREQGIEQEVGRGHGMVRPFLVRPPATPSCARAWKRRRCGRWRRLRD